MQTFSEYIDKIGYCEQEEGFFQSLKSGYQQAYQNATDSSGQISIDYEKYRAKAEPYINKGIAIAQQIQSGLSKIGLSPALAATLIASGLTGGVGAIPLAALVYFADKKLGNVASSAFDAAASKLGFAEWIRMRDQQYLDETKFLGTAGNIIGQAAGYVHGYLSSFLKQIINSLKSGSKQIIEFAAQNKLAIAKAAFMTALGLLAGVGLGSAYKTLTSPDALNTIAQAVTGAQLGSAQDVQNLVNAFSTAPIAHAGAASATGKAVSDAAYAGTKFGNNLIRTAAEA